MDIYHYDRKTGALTGIGKAKRSPLWKPGDRPEDEFLIPALATTEEPPKAIEGHCVVRRGGEWVHEENQRPAEPEPVPEPTHEEKEATERESLIQSKIRELAVSALVSEGKLTAGGKIAKEIVK